MITEKDEAIKILENLCDNAVNPFREGTTLHREYVLDIKRDLLSVIKIIKGLDM